VPYPGRFDGFHAVPASVSKTCLVRFDNNRYVEQVAAHPGVQEMQLGGEQRALHAQQEEVVRVLRVVRSRFLITLFGW
jgi:hypothetical protein